MGDMRALATLLLTGALAACSTPWAYSSMMEIRKQECRKLPDVAERTRCEKEAERSFDNYQSEAEAAKRGGQRQP